MAVTKDFKKVSSAVSKHYLHSKVPAEYRDKYGKTYGKRDVRSLSYAIAKARGIKIH